MSHQFRSAEEYRDHLPCEVCEPKGNTMKNDKQRIELDAIELQEQLDTVLIERDEARRIAYYLARRIQEPSSRTDSTFDEMVAKALSWKYFG